MRDPRDCCPFCGEDYNEVERSRRTATWRVRCGSCGAMGPPAGTDAEACELWRDRQPPRKER
jgi:hypothetical protein